MGINVHDMGDHEIIYTWIDPDTAQETTWAVGRLIDHLMKSDINTHITPVDPHWAKVFCDNRGVEPHRLARINALALTTPIIYCCMPRGTHLLVDGHHRYVYAATHGVDVLPAFILTEKQWEPFTVTGLPQFGEYHLLNSYSGIVD